MCSSPWRVERRYDGRRRELLGRHGPPGMSRGVRRGRPARRSVGEGSRRRGGMRGRCTDGDAMTWPTAAVGSRAGSSVAAGGLGRRARAAAPAISSCVATRFHDADSASRCAGVIRRASAMSPGSSSHSGGRDLDRRPVTEDQEQAREALEARRLRAGLDAADRRLRRSGATGEGCLREAVAPARRAKLISQDGHGTEYTASDIKSRRAVALTCPGCRARARAGPWPCRPSFRR